MTNKDLQTAIENAWNDRDAINPQTKGELRDAIETALNGLDSGNYRVAENTAGRWRVNEWLKKAVLLSFRIL